MRSSRAEYKYYLGALTIAGSLVILALGRSWSLEVFLNALKFLPLAILTEWLEVRIEPIGAFTLTPIVLFMVLLLYGLPLALLVAIGAIAIIYAVIPRKTSQEALHAAAAEVMSLSAFWAVFLLLGGRSGDGQLIGDLLPFAGGFLGYLGTRTTLTAVNFSILEGITFPPLWRALLRRSGGHFFVMALIALGLTYLYEVSGYFVLALATGAIVETYYPWKLLGEQKDVLFTGLRMIAAAVDAKDPHTYTHSNRVAYYAVRMARALRVPEEEVERIRIAALLHDVGKIGISGRIIRKPARLEAQEMQIMRTHSTVSANIIAPIHALSHATDIVRHHHEHYDGSGYPDGLKGEEIPLGSRIILVADALDALTSDRPYRKGCSKEEALQVLRRNAGSQFDSRVVETLARIIHIL